MPNKLFKLVFAAFLAACLLQVPHAQDLAQRAYIVSQIHSNGVTLTYSFSDSSIATNGVIPVTGGTGVRHVPISNYTRSDTWSFVLRTF
ncbi:MAG: hypothetical protein WA639_00600 [Candidatus Acidiferrum sp.]